MEVMAFLYNELELYLMGMAPLSSVSPFDLFSDIRAWLGTETAYEFRSNSRTTYNNASIEDLLGTSYQVLRIRKKNLNF